MLRRKVLTRGQPIVVRVKTGLSGFGRLIGDPDSGWGGNIQAVGLVDETIVEDGTARGPGDSPLPIKRPPETPGMQARSSYFPGT